MIRNTRVTRSSTRLLHPSLSPRVRISLNGPRNIIATRPVSNRRVVSNHPTASFLSVGRTGLLENVARQLAGAQLNSADSRPPPSLHLYFANYFQRRFNASIFRPINRISPRCLGIVSAWPARIVNPAILRGVNSLAAQPTQLQVTPTPIKLMAAGQIATRLGR